MTTQACTHVFELAVVRFKPAQIEVTHPVALSLAEVWLNYSDVSKDDPDKGAQASDVGNPEQIGELHL